VNDPIPEGSFCIHYCGNPRCINVAHLFLGTFQDTNKKRRPKGVKVWSVKLTDSDVKQIRADSRSLREIAESYGVTPATVSHIKNGKIWRHIRSRPGTLVAKNPRGSPPGERSNPAKLTSDQARAIYYDSRSQSVIARDYGIALGTVSAIKTRKHWKHSDL
jgi:DNA invertase Pin-like site-specific DNA recombinase